MGRKNRETYRLVADHMTNRRDGRGITFLGFFDPFRKENKLGMDEQAVYTWLKRGALPTETVKNILKKQGFWQKWLQIKDGKDVSAVPAVPKPPKARKRKKKRDKKEAEAAAKPATAPAAAAAPAAEVKPAETKPEEAKPAEVKA
jgi:small subunit ribosomal protein S16